MAHALKDGVNLVGLTTGMLLGDGIVTRCYEAHGCLCTITSANDGKHARNSLHYSGNAIDYRTRDVPRDKLDSLVGMARVRLADATGQFDVLLESRDEPNEHLHVEFQPPRIVR